MMIKSFARGGFGVLLVFFVCVFSFSFVLALDSDGDGFDSDSHDKSLWDCNDSDSLINPNAVEIFDDVDNDCNGEIDEGAMAYYFDADGDGYGDDWNSVVECFGFENYVEVSGDCDDRNSLVNPGIVEVCGNGVDEDCDGYDSVCGEEAVEISVELEDAVVFVNESDAGAGLGAVIGGSSSGSLIILLVVLVVVGGLIVLIVMMRKEKNKRVMPGM